MIYKYTKETQPNLPQIHIDVANSDMTDKTIEWCRWDAEGGILKVSFTNDLSVSDKEKLDLLIG